MKVYGYVRVSTDDQENSLANQMETLRADAVRRGLTIEHIFVDEDVSAYDVQLRDRPAGKKLWDILDSGDTVLLCKLDRVFRSVVDESTTLRCWHSRGVRTLLVDMNIDTGTPQGRLFLHNLASHAEYESAMTSSRIREVKAYLRKHGRPYGNRPFGWKRDRPGKGAQFVPLESERALARRVAQMHDDGTSFRQITLQLWREKVTKPGKKWGERGSVYHQADVHALAVSARRGFPIVPQARALVYAKQG